MSQDHLSKEKVTSWVGLRVEVCFNYDTERCISGEIVRDDEVTIIKLDDGRYVPSTECQYRLKESS